MDSGSSVPPGVQIVQMSGPQLLSYLFHWGLFGALSVQLYLYYDAFPNDRLSTKCLVYTVYAIELVEAVLITQDAFAIFGYGFGDFTELTNIHLMWLDVPVTSGLVAFIGQSFYAYRVYVLSQSWIIPVLILVVSLISSIGAFFTGAIVLQGVPLAGYMLIRLNHELEAAGNYSLVNTTKISASSGVWCGATVVCDIMIAVCMTYYLSKQVTGFRQTRAVVSKLIRLIIETGTLTALVAVITFILFFAFPGKMYFSVSTCLLPRLYGNCILVILNARCQIVGGRGSYSMSMDFSSTPSYLRNTPPGGNDTHLAIKINQEVLSDTAMRGHVEMKGMGVESPDLGACV
ncbi:hypothetical protein FB451DRAFT_1401566 [Mycena latifolia]|nr:hypothetical protein FB451DRAFT_1401566 [Mycena latifolia]